MTESNDVGAVAARLVNVFNQIGAIAKNQRNEHHGYAYRGIDDVMNELHDVLGQHELFYVPRLVDKEIAWSTTSGNKPLQIATLSYCFDFYDSSGNCLVVGPVAGQAADVDDKAPMQGLSQAAKYTLLQVFCIPVGQDDADAKSPMSQDQGQSGEQRQQHQQVQQSSGSGGGQRMATDGQSKKAYAVMRSQVGLEDHHIKNLLSYYGSNVTRCNHLRFDQAKALIDWLEKNPEKARELAGANNERNAPAEPEQPPPPEPPQDQSAQLPF